MKTIFLAVLIMISGTCGAQQKTACDSVRYYKHKSDSLSEKMFLANFKIEKVKYYLKICQKNPKQDKFLKGWISASMK